MSFIDKKFFVSLKEMRVYKQNYVLECSSCSRINIFVVCACKEKWLDPEKDILRELSMPLIKQLREVEERLDWF